MAVTFFFDTRMCFEWKIENPRMKGFSTSPVFYLDGSRWCFELETKFDELDGKVASRMIYLRLVRGDQRFHTFEVKSYVEGNNERHEYINHRTVSFTSRSSSERISSLLEGNNHDLPDELMVDDVLTLIFLIVVVKPISEPVKAVHTDDVSFQTPSYFDSHPCLDSLSHDINKMLEESSDSDIEVICEDRSLPAHRNVLSARSEVMSKMIHSNMQENLESRIYIRDMQYPILKQFIQYLYTGTLPDLMVGNASALYEAGDKYAVCALKTRCARFLRENVDKENVYDLLVLANAHNDEELKEYIITFILHNEIPRKSDDWNGFCDQHPKLANNVLNRHYRMSGGSKSVP